MALRDLVSPWAAAIDAPDCATAQGAYRTRHDALLESLRLQRAPHAHELSLAASHTDLRRQAGRVADAEWQQRLRDTVARAASAGADLPVVVALLAGDGEGDVAEPLPAGTPMVALFVERGDDAVLHVALATALAALTRWCASDSESRVWRPGAPAWDRWDRARDVPLAEWVYAEGVGVHLAATLFGEVEPHRLLGLSRGAFHRLRERERLLRGLLAEELPQAGLGLVVRWLAPGAPRSARTIAGQVIPPGAGRYLGWRMSADRIARVGVADALRMPAD